VLRQLGAAARLRHRLLRRRSREWLKRIKGYFYKYYTCNYYSCFYPLLLLRPLCDQLLY
jgi:hypothetical protein